MSNTENRSPVTSLYLNALMTATSPGATKEQRQSIVAWRGNPDGTSEVAFVWFDRTTGLVKKDKHGNPMLIWRASQRQAQTATDPMAQLATLLGGAAVPAPAAPAPAAPAVNPQIAALLQAVAAMATQTGVAPAAPAPAPAAPAPAAATGAPPAPTPESLREMLRAAGLAV